MLELSGAPSEPELLALWRARIARAAGHLGWGRTPTLARIHAAGASLALAAPPDQLLTATEINEWALCASLVERDPVRWPTLEADLIHAAAESALGEADLPVLEETAALARLARLAAREASPRLRELLEAANTGGLQYVLDDDTLTLGAGTHGHDFPLHALPAATQVPWNALGNIPLALVTGSNGKTTTVRLIAACLRARGLLTACCCTEGVFLGDEILAAGDYSGPDGARRALRCRQAQAAVLETARGGILRRGLAAHGAAVALVSNISSDHFGEYGIDDLEGLADVKLTVASGLKSDGLLVLNADDELLCRRARSLPQRLGRTPATGWFALDADRERLCAQRAIGRPTCGVRSGRLILTRHGQQHDLGAVDSMPLTVGGSATYNIANLAGAAVAAAALEIPPATIATVFARFGRAPTDNPGRMMRYERGGVCVLIDYAHNADGLRGLLTVAQHLRSGPGRLAVLLGHAGNRRNEEIEHLAEIAAGFRPDLVVIKENEAHLRGREPGEVPRILHAALLRAGLPPRALALRMTEVEAARHALEWARPGDVLALPLHSPRARTGVLEMLGAAS